MFAPHCPTCQRCVLLGPSRIIAAQLDRRPLAVVLRCHCGTVVTEPPIADQSVASRTISQSARDTAA